MFLLKRIFKKKEREAVVNEQSITANYNTSPELGYNWHLAYSDAFNNKIFSTNESLKFVNPAWMNIKGKNCRIFLAEDSNVSKLKIKIVGNGCKLYFGERTILKGAVCISGHQRSLVIGKNTTFQSVSIFIKEGRDVFIGEDCMFSSRIEIRTSDSHSIYDMDTGKRINRSGNVFINDHVWLGKDVIVSKGVVINKNCVVGAKSFVNKSLLGSNCLYAGVPAKKIRSNINWTRELLPFDN